MAEITSPTEYGLVGFIIACITFVIVTYINKKWTSRQQTQPQHKILDHKPCADMLQNHLLDNSKATLELLTIMRQQHEDDREWTRSNQEAMQGLILAINNVISISKEILDRVKELDRRT